MKHSENVNDYLISRNFEKTDLIAELTKKQFGAPSKKTEVAYGESMYFGESQVVAPPTQPAPNYPPPSYPPPSYAPPGYGGYPPQYSQYEGQPYQPYGAYPYQQPTYPPQRPGAGPPQQPKYPGYPDYKF